MEVFCNLPKKYLGSGCHVCFRICLGRFTTCFCSSGASYLASSLQIQNLRLLDLSHNGLTDLSAQNLAQTLARSSFYPNVTSFSHSKRILHHHVIMSLKIHTTKTQAARTTQTLQEQRCSGSLDIGIELYFSATQRCTIWFIATFHSFDCHDSL